MDGLKICTRCRAISARRRRRISSSLLPENIGPTTTSIQPMLPLTMSTQRLLERPNPKLSRTCRGAQPRGRLVHLHIVERREGGDHCQAERFLARDQVVAQHAPGALASSDADGAG